MWIQVSNSACHFMDQFDTFSISKNTNHAIADNWFIRNVIEHALDDDIMSAFKINSNLSNDEKMTKRPNSQNN